MTDIAKPLAVVLLMTVLTLVSAQSNATQCVVTVSGQDLTIPMNQSRGVKTQDGKHYTSYACISSSGVAESGVLVECGSEQCAGGSNNILSCMFCLQVYTDKFTAGDCANTVSNCDNRDVSECKDNPATNLVQCCTHCKDSLTNGGGSGQ